MASASLNINAFNWLPQTKFLLPVVNNSNTVLRSRLLNNLKTVVSSHRLILISAPAGSGKTTLLASLPQALPSLSMGWLSLDEDDNDPIYFLAAMTLALRQLNPDFGATILSLLDDLNLSEIKAEWRRLASLFINEVLQKLPDEFMLVLDDMHLVTEPAIYLLLDYLLERLPPQMHLGIASRHDPPLGLARLRARGHLIEFRLEQLRFTSGEIENFLNEKLNLRLSPDNLRMLESHTEGWAAGLRILANSLDRLAEEPEREAFLEELYHTDRYLFDYLAEEVLNQQDAETRNFLLQTSILVELTPALCEAVIGRTDARAILEKLYHQNLFLTAVAVREQIYRYHDLFAVFLRSRLQVEQAGAFELLHKKAALAQTSPALAIRHYLAAELYEEAAVAIEQVGREVIRHGSVITLKGWIEALPEDVRDAHPWLNLYLAMCSTYLWQLDRATLLGEKAFHAFEKSDDLAGYSLAAVQMGIYQGWKKNFVERHRMYLLGLEGPLPPNIRLQAQTLASFTYLLLGQLEEARQSADKAISLAEACDSTQQFLSCFVELTTSICSLPGAYGRLKKLEQIVLSKTSSPADNERQALLSLIRAALRFWEGHWEEAMLEIGDSSRFVNYFGTLTRIMIIPSVFQGMYYAWRGDYTNADQYFETILRLYDQPDIASFYSHWKIAWHFWYGRVKWQQGDLAVTRRMLEKLKAFEEKPEWPFASLLRNALTGMLYLSEHNFSMAEKAFLEAIPVEESLGYFTYTHSDVRLLLAYLYLRWQRPKEALQALAKALPKYVEQDMPGMLMWQGKTVVLPLMRLAQENGLFTSFVSEMLDKFGEKEVQNPPKSQQSFLVKETGETLTPREIEVIELIGRRASNREIAESLVISEPTVKSHVNRIFRKLNVTSRYEVIEKAHNLGLLTGFPT
ncbi:MAG TPA: LuxR C-terminal-related transcriptional regulator [Chloroflexia bacterium]|nr:LuxR C-terminal-related transcriptional regulator [Chloroflexia bacterium]